MVMEGYLDVLGKIIGPPSPDIFGSPEDFLIGLKGVGPSEDIEPTE